MADGAAFCTNCGAKTGAAPVGTGGAAAAPAPASAKSSNVLKIVLIVFGVLVFLGIAGAVVTGLLIKKAVDSAVQTDASGNVTSVNLGGVKVDANKDAAKTIASLGIEVYPGATPVDESAGSVTLGPITSTHAQFTTTASMDEVFNFYKAKYPQASLFDTPEGKTLAQGSEDKEMLTIAVQTEDGKTLLNVTKVVKNAAR